MAENLKESKCKTIEEILETKFSEEERKKIEQLVEFTLNSAGCENVYWLAFNVYMPSIPIMETILKAMATEYIMVIADKIVGEDVKVKIALKKAKETSLWTIRRNNSEIIASLSISEKRFKALRSL